MKPSYVPWPTACPDCHRPQPGVCMAIMGEKQFIDDCRVKTIGRLRSQSALAYEMGWAASRSFWLRRMAGDNPPLPENPFMEGK